ncbi:MAG: extracellular solute-binding protein [Rhodobacteraceae bacterium]|jgi:putative spermidine/putrescine transport system substrate-binding protein|nr:extracellular solute-binding protein [Paracoccaceae bacterium]
MTDVTRRGVLTALAALAGTGILGVPALRAATEELVVTTYGGSWEQFWRDTLIPGFTAATGVTPRVDTGLGRVYTTNIRAAGVDAPPYGVVMTNEIFATVLRGEGYFEQLDQSLLPNYADLHPVATRAAQGGGVVGMISPIGLGYRTDLVSAPKGWGDLWTNPEYKGRIGLYNIVNTAGKMMVMLTSRLYGRDIYDMDAGFAKLKELGQVIQTDFNMSTAFAAGEVAIAPFDFGEIARLRNQGLPVDCIIPEEGMMMWDQTFSIAKNIAARDAAYAYLNYILSPAAQELLLREFFVTPVNTKVAVPPDLARDVPVSGDAMDGLIAWDWDWVNANAEELTRRWNETFAA